MRKESKFKQTENKRFSEPSSKMKKTKIGLIPKDWNVVKVKFRSIRFKVD